MGIKYDVYFGDDPDDLSRIVLDSELLSVAQLYLATVLGTGLYSHTYYWRVDIKNDYGLTEGDTWGFSTIGFLPPVASTGLIWDPDTEEFRYITTGESSVANIKRLVAVAADRFWFENI